MSAVKDESSASESEDASPSKKTKRSKGTPRKGNTMPIPTSYEEANAADRQLLRMKDVEGRSWKEIQAAWEDLTGVTVASSSLPPRYYRMKANFIILADGDVSGSFFFPL